jgi:hypothetical protein
MQTPMVENEEKNSRLFYLIIALIVLGFIASLAFPINAQEHKLGDASGLNAGGIASDQPQKICIIPLP